VVIVFGTSLQVYPAAGLMNYAPAHFNVFYIDSAPSISSDSRFEVIAKTATAGMKEICTRLER